MKMTKNNANTASFKYLGGVLMLMIATSISGSPKIAHAHGSVHAGPIVEQVNQESALDAALPLPAKMVKKIEVLDQDDVAWARETYGVNLNKGVYSYYLAKDEESGEVVGGAVINRSRFLDGKLSLALGLDADLRVASVVVMSANRSYLFELKATVGNGTIESYSGMSVEEVVTAKELSYSNKTVREFAATLRDATALLATLMQG